MNHTVTLTLIIELLHFIVTILNCFIDKDHSVSANCSLLLMVLSSDVHHFIRKYYIHGSESPAELLLSRWMVERTQKES